jgi:phage baseplate assembly protein W|tara:strand:- start:1028 stop:1492 length:465 start_codon:yes stop_codon:yes gene_type:complete
MSNADQTGAWRNPAGLIDAESTNNKRSVRKYTDLDLFFATNNRTKDVNVLSDIQAVKRSVRNLVLMNQYEKPFRPEIYSGIRDMLFEQMTPLTATILAKKVEDVIENFEPRARLMGVRATPDLDRNAYNIAIEFYVINVPTELVDLTIMLERLR